MPSDRTQALPRATNRYELVTAEKAGGATYTPQALADFVAEQIVYTAGHILEQPHLKVFDPAVGGGELLASLLGRLPRHCRPFVSGYEIDDAVLGRTAARLRRAFPGTSISLQLGDFLHCLGDVAGPGSQQGLFDTRASETHDLVIANPPYVRTQIMGAGHAKEIARRFGLSGRVDLYHAFVLGIASVLAPDGVAGIILSNRFMTTRAGASLRQALRTEFSLLHVWDLGDTKLFDAAVLPAVLLVEGKRRKRRHEVMFTSIYETRDPAISKAETPLDALRMGGMVRVPDGRRFRVQQGKLDASGGPGAVWRLGTHEGDAWLAAVDARTWRRFGDIGKIRVGVKTCADKVFIGTHWGEFPEDQRPELLRPLLTHHIARPFRADASKGQRLILYPHESVDGQRKVVDLSAFPKSRAYLERHRETLEGRRYVLEAGRQWYEIWVPQDPAGWENPKLVFRDIAERPCFWIDGNGSIVNGDCYWMSCDRKGGEDLLWLAAAVGNSTFIETFYDRRFHNKLYAGRRRFITQYVETFPLPDPYTSIGTAIIANAKAASDDAGSQDGDRIVSELDRMVWEAFGLDIEEVAW